jgi:hypothetical protein
VAKKFIELPQSQVTGETMCMRTFVRISRLAGKARALTRSGFLSNLENRA